MSPDEIKKWLQAYEEGLVTKAEFEVRISDSIMEENLAHLRGQDHGPVMHFIGGTFSGPLPHDYGLFDISAQTKAFYNFTLFNVLRFFWNKLMRRFGWHRLTKVW